MKSRAARLQDINGISAEMVDKLIAVVAEGLATGNEDLRHLLYCAYREARNIERSYSCSVNIRYRLLIKGELIEHGDEILTSEKEWSKAMASVGTHAPAPEYISSKQYRRRLRGVFDEEPRVQPTNMETVK